MCIELLVSVRFLGENGFVWWTPTTNGYIRSFEWMERLHFLHLRDGHFHDLKDTDEVLSVNFRIYLFYEWNQCL